MDFDALWVWDDPTLAHRLDWYRQVAVNRLPAKFLLARRIPVRGSFEALTEEQLWTELDELTPDFVRLRDKVRRGGELPSPPVRPNLLDLVVELSRRMLTHCNFCRWNCRVDRSAPTKYGACQLAEETRVSSFFHHRGEELVFRGTHGSGTIFFTSCNMRCSFCQNGDISTDKDNGQQVSARELALMAWQLRREGCHNVNWVGGDPTIHLHTILEAISLLGGEVDERALGRTLRVKSDMFVAYQDLAPEVWSYRGELNVPMLWNSNFFMTAETMKLLRLVIDVWLPDFKFGPGACAVKLARTPWYWETVTGNLSLLEAWGEDYAIRHLVMPNHVECCTQAVLDWVARHIPEAPVNVMDQYHPDTFCDPRSPRYQEKYAEISRRPTSDEVIAAFRYAEQKGVRYQAVTYEKNLRGLRL